MEDLKRAEREVNVRHIENRTAQDVTVLQQIDYTSDDGVEMPDGYSTAWTWPSMGMVRASGPKQNRIGHLEAPEGGEVQIWDPEPEADRLTWTGPETATGGTVIVTREVAPLLASDRPDLTILYPDTTHGQAVREAGKVIGVLRLILAHRPEESRLVITAREKTATERTREACYAITNAAAADVADAEYHQEHGASPSHRIQSAGREAKRMLDTLDGGIGPALSSARHFERLAESVSGGDR